MNVKTQEDYKKVAEEQAKALNILAKRCKEKDKEIVKLNKELAHLRWIIRVNENGGKNEKECD